MRNLRSVLGVAALLAVAGCRQTEGPGISAGVVKAPIEVDLRIGQSVWVDSVLEVGVAGVPADSRCPSTVVCVWEGEASVAVTHRLGMGPTAVDTLHTSSQPRSIMTGWFSISIVNVQPYPATPGAIDPNDYVVRLSITHVTR